MLDDAQAVFALARTRFLRGRPDADAPGSHVHQDVIHSATSASTKSLLPRRAIARRSDPGASR